MSWPFVTLSELVDIKGGGTPSKQVERYWNGDIPWASVKDFKSGLINSTQDYISQAGVDNSATNIIPKGALIVPTRMALGKVAFTGCDMAINQDVKALIIKDNDKVHSRYLFRFLESKAGYIEAQGQGATVKGIKLEVLRGLSVPTPPLAEQKRIAAILDKADQLRQKRQQAIALADEFLRSVFLDMFGDPVTNPKGWEVRPLGVLLANIDSGCSPKCHPEPAENDQWGILKLGAVTQGVYKERENKALPQNEKPRAEFEVKKGDLLFTRKNTYELVAATAFVHKTRDKLLLPDLIFRLKLPSDSLVKAEYLWATLSHPGKRKRVQSLAGGAAGSMPNISKANLKTVEIPVPPMELQQQFQSILSKHYQSQEKVRMRDEQTDCLFNSLSQKAFASEL